MELSKTESDVLVEMFKHPTMQKYLLARRQYTLERIARELDIKDPAEVQYRKQFYDRGQYDLLNQLLANSLFSTEG